jgi:hypothetical protein
MKAEGGIGAKRGDRRTVAQRPGTLADLGGAFDGEARAGRSRGCSTTAGAGGGHGARGAEGGADRGGRGPWRGGEGEGARPVSLPSWEETGRAQWPDGRAARGAGGEGLAEGFSLASCGCAARTGEPSGPPGPSRESRTRGTNARDRGGGSAGPFTAGEGRAGRSFPGGPRGVVGTHPTRKPVIQRIGNDRGAIGPVGPEGSHRLGSFRSPSGRSTIATGLRSPPRRSGCRRPRCGRRRASASGGRRSRRSCRRGGARPRTRCAGSPGGTG